MKFYTASDARSNPDGQLTVRNRVEKIFEHVKKRHGNIFDANDEIKLSQCSLVLGQHTIRCNDHLCVRVKKLLKEKGLKVTNQRLLVLEVLADHRDTHMTAEDIYDL